MNENIQKFTSEKMAEKLDSILEKYTKNTPQQVQLKLPKLKKVNAKESEAPKITLPKLKKVTA